MEWCRPDYLHGLDRHRRMRANQFVTPWARMKARIPRCSLPAKGSLSQLARSTQRALLLYSYCLPAANGAERASRYHDSNAYPGAIGSCQRTESWPWAVLRLHPLSRIFRRLGPLFRQTDWQVSVESVVSSQNVELDGLKVVDIGPVHNVGHVF